MSIVKENANKLLKEYLKDHGISQTWLAHKIGLSTSSVNWRLNGRVKVDADFIIAASFALDLSPDIFFKKNYADRIKVKQGK